MTTTNVGKIETIPSELLLRIFALATDKYDPRCEPFVGWAPSTCPELSEDLHVKKALVRVCKTWRCLALEMLYRRIYIYRQQQLRALLGVLEEEVGYRDWIQHIHGAFRLEGPSRSYVKNTQKLLVLCSSCKELSWHPFEYVVVPRQFNTINILCNMPAAQPPFHTLRKLSITLDFKLPLGVSLPALSSVSFPKLEELVLETSTCPFSPSLDIITRLFILPNLRLVTITSFERYHEFECAEDPTSIYNFLERHEGKLTTFTLHYAFVHYPIQKSLEDILKLTPNLVSIGLFPHALPSSDATFASPCLSLNKVELYVDNHVYVPWVPSLGTQRSGAPRSIKGFLSMAANRANFPCLKSIVILDARTPGRPFDSGSVAHALIESTFRYFLPWVARLRELDIALLRVDLEPLISPEEEERKSWKLLPPQDNEDEACVGYELDDPEDAPPDFSD